MLDEGTIFSVSGVIYLPHSLPHVSLVFRCTFTLSIISCSMCSFSVHVSNHICGCSSLMMCGIDGPLSSVKQAPTSSPSTFSSHHPHLYTVEEDCAPAKGDEDILYLHTGQDQGGGFIYTPMDISAITIKNDGQCHIWRYSCNTLAPIETPYCII